MLDHPREAIAHAFGALHPNRGRVRVATALPEPFERHLDVLVIDADTAGRRASEVVRAVGTTGYLYITAGKDSRLAAKVLVGQGLTRFFDLAEVPPGAPRILAPPSCASLDWVSRCGLIFGDRPAVVGLRMLARIPRLLGNTIVPVGTLLGGALAVPPGDDLVDLIPGGLPLGAMVLPLSSARDRVVALALDRSVPVVITIGAGAGIATVAREERSLAGIAARAGGAGAEVPHLIGSRHETGSLALIQSMVEGSLAANVIKRTPTRLGPILRSVGEWIGHWQRRTADSAPLSAALAADAVLVPCDRLGATLAPGYRIWLEALLRDSSGSSVTRADAHGDLTMANVVLARPGVGVVDWVSAVTGRIALQDLVYACCDGVAAIDSYGDRRKAFDSSFRPGGPHARLVSDVVGSAALEVAPATRKLAFHACWLRHALDERGSGGPDGPFVAIAAALSRDPDGFMA